MFEIVQEMTIRVYHCVGKSTPLSDEGRHTWMGDVCFHLADLMRAPGGLSLKLAGGRNTLVTVLFDYSS